MDKAYGPGRGVHPVDRALDGMEQTLWLASSFARINAQAIVRIAGPLTEDALRTALEAAQHRHPLLGVHVVAAPQGPRFVSEGTPPIPLRVATLPASGDWTAESERELAAPIRLEEGPLIKACWLRGDGDHWLLLTFHHVIGDGHSCVALVRDVLAAASAHLQGQAPKVDRLPEMPAIAQLSPLGHGGRSTWPRIAAEYVRLIASFLAHPPGRLRWDGHAPNRERKPRLIHHDLDPAATSALAQRARAEGTTILGALTAACVIAAAEDHGREPVRLACVLPVNLRPYLPKVPADAFGYYAWSVGSTLRIAPGTRFWDVARQVKRDAEGEIQRGALWLGLAILERRAPMLVQKGPDALAKMLDEKYPGALSVSNVGRLEVPTDSGPLRWTDMQFGMSADAAGAGLAVAATGFAGKLSVNVMHPDPLIAPPRAAAIAARAMALLREAGHADPVAHGGR